MRHLVPHCLPCLILAVILDLSGNSVFAASSDSAFDAANTLYEQGKFAEAASAYEKLIESGSRSPALFFNLGNAQFKAGDAGRAIAAYRRAERLDPRDPDLRANLQFVQNQIQGPTLQPDAFQRGLKHLTVNEWTVLTGIAFWLTFILLTLTLVHPRWRSALRTSIIVLSLGTIACATCLIVVLSGDSTPIAIVIAKSATVHNGPLDESPSTMTVHDGAELNVLDTKDGWLQVGINNRVGWLKRDQAIVQTGS